MKLLYYLVFLLFICNHSVAQTEKVTVKTANRKAIKAYQASAYAFNHRDYIECRIQVLKALKAEPGFVDALMGLGDVEKILGNFDAARASYHKLIGIEPKTFKKVYWSLGVMEAELGNYQAAIEPLEKYLASKNIFYSFKLKAEAHLRNVYFAIQAMKNPVPFEPENLGDNVNSELSEYKPSISTDEQVLVFTRRMPAESRMNPFNEDFYISYKKEDHWGPAQPLGKPINTYLNEGAHSISPDGRGIYFTACNRPDGLGSCDIFYSVLQGNVWSEPKNLGKPINSAAWESQPSISSDGNSLYFCSGRAGGKGKIDIWVSHRDEDGKWQAPENLGENINTRLDEQSPFIHPDNQTLYFSSPGHTGMGAEDLYLVRKDSNGVWGSPQNLGYPINTKDTEASLSVSADGQYAFLSSDRFDTRGELDLYTFPLPMFAQPQKVGYVKGVIFDKHSKTKLGATIELIDLETGKTVIQSSSDKVNGTYLVCLISGRDYAFNVSLKGYLFHSEHFSMKTTSVEPQLLDIGLQPIKAGENVILRNIFFETGSYTLKSASMVELGRLVVLLKENPGLKIEIGGHTDNVGNTESNLLLSRNRAKAVMEFLRKEGVLPARLSARGYGDSLPIATNDSPKGRALNRRTAFTVL